MNVRLILNPSLCPLWLSSLIEWLAGPGRSPQIRESNADLENHGLLISQTWNEIDGLLLATFSNHSALWLDRLFIRPQTVTSTHWHRVL
jgi:hypothetical protein